MGASCVGKYFPDLQFVLFMMVEQMPYAVSEVEKCVKLPLFMNTGQKQFLEGTVTGQLVFFPVISYGANRFLCKNFSSPPAMSYDKFCFVPY